MGRIVQEVITGHLAQYPDEEPILRAFVQNFDITWAKRRRAGGSDLSVYFLKPEAHMERAFGFESEILAVYSSYDKLEPRTFQAIEQFLSDEPARGRVDTMVAFVISESAEPISWVKQYMTANPDSRLFAAFSAHQLRASAGDAWAIRTVLASQLYQRDLFDYRLPINSDFFFFGREDLIFDLHNAYKRSENRGLFGLRKTGKTSVFFKLQRLVESERSDRFVYVDCKFPPHRSSRWYELLHRVAIQLDTRLDKRQNSDPYTASDVFIEALRHVDANARICIVFDEIEYISPSSPLDSHWQEGFVPFWQTIWYAQSVSRNLSVFVGGVNPSVVERDLIGTTQNPLFGIVPHQYLGGLALDEIRRMLRTLGRPMGIRFSESAVQHVYRQYGGHPLLTRIACSLIYRELHKSAQQLPATVESPWLRETEEYREAELGFYCAHVVSELRLFYPEEYELMSEVAKGNLADIYELAVEPTFTTHLKDYGLLNRDNNGRPSIAIPVLQRYARLQDARENGRQTISFVQPPERRQHWLTQRKNEIDSNFELLQRLVKQHNQPLIFGPNNYPESHRFFKSSVVQNENDFAAFINTCNRCFVEPVEAYGKSIGDNEFFWKKVPESYPELSLALRRIKVYRHHRVHIRLESNASDELGLFLARDLAGQNPSMHKELWFHLQQCVLDELFIATLVETERFVQ